MDKIKTSERSGIQEKIISEMVKVFRQLDECVGDGMDRGEWTEEILKTLSRVGEKKFNCIARSRWKGDLSEWLWDMCWHQREDSGFLKEVPLAVEIEWGNLNEITKDFEKLLAARALVRVMVYDARENGEYTARGIVEKLRGRVKEFNGKRGDVYLLIAAEGGKRPWKYFKVVDQGMKRQPSLLQISLQAKKNITWVVVRG